MKSATWPNASRQDARVVAAICPDAPKFAKIQKAVAGCLPAEDLKRVRYYSSTSSLNT